MFTNFIEESYELLYLCDHIQAEIWDQYKDEISYFIKCLKEIKREAENVKEILLKNGWLDVMHPKAINCIDLYNGKSITESTQLFYTPELIDLYPYLIKYWYKINKDKNKDVHKASNHSR